MKRTLFIPLLFIAFYPAFDAVAQHKDSIVLEGVRIEAQQPLSSVSSTTIIPKEIILKSKKSSLLSLLSQYVPGLFVTERGTAGYGIYSGSAGAISLRGVGGSPTTQVLIAIDGQPQYMGINGHHLPDAYRNSNIERLEVTRGPASTLYGSNAMGGVINIITSAPLEGVRTMADLSYGSYNTQKYLLTNSFKKKKAWGSLAINHDRTDGHRPFSKFNLTGGDIKLGYDISPRYKLSAYATMADYRSMDPGTIQKPSPSDTLTADVTRLSTLLSFENRFDKSTGGIRLSYNYGRHDLYYGWLSRDHSIGASIYQTLSLVENNKITLGFDYNRYGGIAEDRSKPAFHLDKYMNESAFYLIVEQILIDKITLTAGIRGNFNPTFGTNYIPQAGVSYAPNETSRFKVSVAKGFRNPSLRELYIFAPNDSLKPESMINYELSYLYRSKDGRLSTEASFYLSKGNNIIETIFVNNIPRYNYNSGSFQNVGFEVAASYRFNRHLNMAVNYGYVHQRKPMLASPRGTLNVSADWSFAKKFNAMATVQYIDRLYTRVGAIPQKNSFVLANLLLSYQSCRWGQLYGKINNLLDKTYEMNYGYPMPGITFTVGMSINIGK